MIQENPDMPGTFPGPASRWVRSDGETETLIEDVGAQSTNMHLLLWTVFLVLRAGEGSGQLQTLTCPYQEHQRALPRVWCKQATALCCNELPYNTNTDGRVAISEDEASFSISVEWPPSGDGMYWCGVLANETVFIKLAQIYFGMPTDAYVWSIARWVVVPILALSLLVPCCFQVLLLCMGSDITRNPLLDGHCHDRTASPARDRGALMQGSWFHVTRQKTSC